ncbi:phage tail tape measure protein [Vagococcus hydrophili]|uniref:Phage tail tape measure protein n=1 Tax=Vagococcus hydrophili TaxID=2714947 RepID=A0A6G8ARC7_9ENTE|nr:phage tail tape measure protein [Vagococcus hydrophili]QIL47547.1 phage tail tape measure protein [Vagococcus hydrophili]
MSTKESDVVLRFKTSGEVSYSKTVKEINKEINLAATEYKNHTSAMDKDATATEKLTATKQKLEKQLSLAENRTKLLREQYEKAAKETGEYSNESQKLYKKLLESETGENKLRDALEETNEALKEQGNISIDTAKKIQKIEEAGTKVKDVGKRMSLGLTAPILGIGAAALSSFTELDDSLDGITTATGATGSQLESLQDSFKNVIDNIPAEMSDISSGIGEVNTQFGLMGKELEGTTESMLKFSEINGSEVSDSTINAKKSMDLFRLSMDDLPMVLDVVSKTSQDTGVGVDKLFEAVNSGAPQLKNMGLGFAESTTLIGQMEKAGIDSAGAIGYLAKANVNYAKDNKTMQEGLGGTISAIQGATTEQEKLRIASEVFGSKSAPKMIEAIDGGSLSMDGLANAAKDAAGTVDKTFEEIQDPIDKAKIAQNQLKEGMGELGEQIQITLLPIFETVSKSVKSVTDWFRSLSDENKQMIVWIGIVIAAIGPLLVILGSFMGSISKIVTGVNALMSVWSALTTFLAANPFVLIAAAIAAFITGLVWAYNNVEWFHDGVNAFFKGISDVIVQVCNYISGYLGGVFDGVLVVLGSFVDAGMKIFDGLIDFISGVFTGNWSQAWEGVQKIFGGVFDGLVALAKAPLNLIISLINGVIGGLNKIKMPDWVPKMGGKGINISEIPYLAEGGHLLNGQAIVGEAGPELLSNKNGKTTVTPLSDREKKEGFSGKGHIGNGKTEVHIHIAKVDANNPSDLDRANRQMAKAAKQAIIDAGGVPV